MKKNYNIPEINLIAIELNDVITTSLGDEIVVNADNIFNINKPTQP